MKTSTTEKLSRLGLDIDFLRWLEGEADRLPRLDAVARVRPDDFLGAVRAAAWLRQLFAQPDAVVPRLAEEWNSRYWLLEEFLWVAMRWSSVSSFLRTPADLAALETVLETLLPKSSSERYKADIWDLRRKGYPALLRSVAQGQRPRRGGKEISEQTRRMRAAVSYVQTVSRTPYADLADFWNESTKRSPRAYQPDEIKSRLRKEQFPERRHATGQDLLEFWTDIYNGKLRAVFPGPWPLSNEIIEALARQR